MSPATKRWPPVAPLLAGRPPRAFTLLEVLIALGIFALAAAAFLTAINSGVQVITRAAQNDAFGENQRFALRQILAIEDEETFEEGGEFTLPNDGFLMWAADIEPTQTLGVFRVELLLEQELDGENFGGAERREERLSVFLYRPAWGDPADNAALRDDVAQRFDDLQADR